MKSVSAPGWRHRVWFAVTVIAFFVACSSPRFVTVETAAPVDRDSIAHAIIFVGDAGGAAEDDPVLAAARGRAAWDPDNTTVIFLGDMVYPNGMPDQNAATRVAAEQIVRTQTGVSSGTGARGIVLPGNHDWGEGAPNPHARIQRLESFVRAEGLDFLPANGCPGPTGTDVGNLIKIIALDTQWWLENLAAEVPVGACSLRDPAGVTDSLRVLLSSAGNRQVVIVGHHPLDSYGPHGGYFSFRDHVFPLTRVVDWLWVPLPLIGSVYPLYRRSGVLAQDLGSKKYRRLREDIGGVLSDFRPLVFAGGHEHSLQVLRGEGARYNLVSGAGYLDHSTPVGWKDETLFAASAGGYIVLEFLLDGRVRLAVTVVGDAGAPVEAFSAWLE